MKAYPTLYRGIQMRSRLESRWAAMFDHLGWTWHYEPLDFNGWIPDFLILTPHKAQILVEVKPITVIDNDVVAKIERALGYPTSPDDDDEAFDPGYEILLVGAIAPIESQTDRNSIGWMADDCGGWCSAVINEPEGSVYGLTTGHVGLWHDRILSGRHHKDALRPVPEDEVAALWARAVNASQWKAPK